VPVKGADKIDRARAAAFSRHGVETWEFDVLAALRRSGRPYQLSPGQLVAQTMVTSGTMTNRIDRLQARGLVTRRPDPTDGRGVIVGLTEHGRELVDASLADLLDVERAMLAGLDPAARERLTALLRDLLSPLEA
jgi:DNA-binding MarR family transcriptional regulator